MNHKMLALYGLKWNPLSMAVRIRVIPAQGQKLAQDLPSI